MTDGTFTDLRTHWFGHIGVAGIGLHRHAGGILTITADDAVPPLPMPDMARCGWAMMT